MPLLNEKLAGCLETLQEPVLLIGSISFEPRCLSVVKTFLQLGISPEQVRMIDYELDYPTASITQAERLSDMRRRRRDFQEQNRREAEEMLGPDGLSETKTIANPLVETLGLVRGLADIWGQQIDAAGTVLVDVTTMTKLVMFPLIRLLRTEFTVPSLAVANSVPGSYSHRLTYEIGGLGIVPAFNGETRTDRPNALIAVLGFDGDKFENIVEEWDFEVVVPVVGFPAFHPGLQDRTIWENAKVLRTRLPDNRVSYCPSLDPAAALTKLTEIHADLASAYNVWFAPLGPKPMAVAVALVAQATNSRVVMAYPQAYDPEYSSDCADICIWTLGAL